MKTYLFAFLITSILTGLFGFMLLPLLKRLKVGQEILSYVKEHKSKSGTPTMGGLFFIPVACVVCLVLCATEARKNCAVVSVIALSFMCVGFLDDFIKIKFKKNEGLKPYQKLFFQLAVAVIASIYVYTQGYTAVNIPFFSIRLTLRAWIIPLAVTVFLATSNCVNLTDGLDGLAGSSCCIYFVVFAVLITMQKGSSDMALICTCFAGSLSGFLLFNVNKAKVFMGDTGSLALGGTISALAMFTENVLFIPVIGFVFVMSGLSVIIQVLYYKRTKKRVFLMSPIHHHFQMKGMTEAKISYIYSYITLFCGIVSLIFS